MSTPASVAVEPGTAPAPDGWRQRLTGWLRGGGWVAVAAYLIAQAGLLFWWAANFPGLFSPDSLDYIWQSTTGNWNNHHSIPYTALVWVSLQLTGGVGALTLGQTVAMALAVAYLLTGLRRLGAPAAALLPAAAVLVALPPVGTFFACVWKDVGFVIAVTFLAGTLVRLVAADRERRGGHLVALLAVEALLAAVFRQNGFVMVVIVAAVGAAVLAGARLKIAVAGLAAIVVALGLNLAVLPALGVQNGFAGVSLEAFAGDIAVAYRHDPGSFTAEDRAALATTAPLSLWESSGTCASTDTTVYDPAYDRDASIANKDALMGVWYRVARRTPGEVIATRWCRGSLAWSVTPRYGLSRNPNPWSAKTYVARDPRMGQTPFRGAVVSKPLNDTVYRLAQRGVRATNGRGVEWIAWRGATLAYLTYVVVAFAVWRRRNPTLLLIAVPTAAVQLSVLLVNNVQAARYMAAPYIVGVLLLPLLFVKRSAPVEEGQDG